MESVPRSGIMTFSKKKPEFSPGPLFTIHDLRSANLFHLTLVYIEVCIHLLNVVVIVNSVV